MTNMRTVLLSLALAGQLVQPAMAQTSAAKAQPVPPAPKPGAVTAKPAATPGKPDGAAGKADGAAAKSPAQVKSDGGSGSSDKAMVLRFAGSPAVGEALAGDLVKAFARTIKLPASRTVIGLDPSRYEIIATGGEGDRTLRVAIEAEGTAAGPRAFASGAADLWMAARQATQTDVDDAARHAASGPSSAHVPTLDQVVSKEWEHPVALDVLAIIVNPKNSVKALTLAQLRDIFSGKVKNWSAVGGPELPISVFTPSLATGEFDSFCETVMGLTDPADCQKAIEPVARRQFESSADLSDEIASGAGAIGFSSTAFQRGTHTVAIATECGTVSPPTGSTVKGDEYPLMRRLYFYAPASQNGEIGNFINFVTSDAAQPVIESAGYIGLKSASGVDTYLASRLESAGDARDGGRTRIRPADVGLFEDATHGATRLPITLHFQPGSDELDTRAQSDLRRLAALMHSPAYEKSELLLIGYSQALGDYATNHEISQHRVDAVRSALSSTFSVNAAMAVGVGPAAPVACNLEPTGRFLNQRVEAWVRPGK